MQGMALLPGSLSSVPLALQEEWVVALALAAAAALLGLGVVAWWWWRRVSGPVRIAELWVYPLKSCAGVRMDVALLQV